MGNAAELCAKEYKLMRQLLAKGDNPFTGGRDYYNHPNVSRDNFPKIIHQSSATGMQVYLPLVLLRVFSI